MNLPKIKTPITLPITLRVRKVRKKCKETPMTFAFPPNRQDHFCDKFMVCMLGNHRARRVLVDKTEIDYDFSQAYLIL